MASSSRSNEDEFRDLLRQVHPDYRVALMRWLCRIAAGDENASLAEEIERERQRQADSGQSGTPPASSE